MCENGLGCINVLWLPKELPLLGNMGCEGSGSSILLYSDQLTSATVSPSGYVEPSLVKLQEWQRLGLFKEGEKWRMMRMSDLKKQRLGGCESTLHTSQQLLGGKEEELILHRPNGQVETKGERWTHDEVEQLHISKCDTGCRREQ